jgi:hypothetical protein
MLSSVGMRFRRVLSLIAIAPVVLAVACSAELDVEEDTDSSEEAVRANRPERCEEGERSDAEGAAIDRRIANASEGSGSIDVYVHVIHTTEGYGNVEDATIGAQIAVLNQGFAGTGFGFRLAKVLRIANDAWALSPGGEKSKIRKRLHRGSARDLNIYLTPGLDGLGVASFPDKIEKHGLDLDGVFVNTGTLPGGALAPNNLGRTAVHETGHWLGLFHVFQGGCKGNNGDFVEDTPPQKMTYGGCEVGRDTCGKQKGKDSVKNFMSYSDDPCYAEFTRGQIRRMQKMWSEYRAK